MSEFINLASWGWPQATFILLTAIGWGIQLVRGEIGKSLIGDAVIYTLLICGGFFA